MAQAFGNITSNMDVKLVAVIIVILTISGGVVDAGLLYDQTPSNLEDLKKLGLECLPGRTVIRVGRPQEKVPPTKPNEDSDEDHMRRSHMNSRMKEENCRICVCSVEGKDEFCWDRPARNVNECIRMAMFNDEMKKNVPYSHDRVLAYRIRRDYIWHYDEIPYDSKAACRRGTSYYSNNIDAYNTTIEVDEDIDSLLDYDNKDICYYCVCSVSGYQAGCISRNPWYCEYYRKIREPQSARDKYRQLFEQDRPAYFRELSYRVRRRMDDGIYDLLNIVGDRSKNNKCIPLVSEYSDCSSENACNGCTRCTCNKEGNWSCMQIFDCPNIGDDSEPSEEVSVPISLDTLYEELTKKEKQGYIPAPPNPDEDILLDKNEFVEEFETFMGRQKRSFNNEQDNNKNHTVKFYNTVDEFNEDTLTNSSVLGTIEAQKFKAKVVSKPSRRTTLKDNKNNSDLNALHIELNKKEEYDQHIDKNVIDTVNNKPDPTVDPTILKLLQNFPQDKRDKDLSKLIVTELKSGMEIVGDKSVNPMSNITFTPENDTLTAMAFIAGNLLNKLWDMEQVASDGSIEADNLKHEKINDLRELFKEPLSLRQETFLKNALEKLSHTIDNNKNAKNISICETFEQPQSGNIGPSTTIDKSKNKTKCISDASKTQSDKPHNITNEVVEKLNNVMNLIKRFDDVQKNIGKLKDKYTDTSFDQEPELATSDTFHTFGNVLDKISKLLIPNKHQKGKKQLRNPCNNDNKIKHVKLGNYEFNLNTVNMTDKDKLLLDYISHIEANPSCLYGNTLHREDNKSLFNLEGGILYNLSEFLKIKSFEDLVKSFNKDKIIKVDQEVTTSSTTTVTKNLILNETSLLRSSANLKKTKLQTTKEKLKIHLKAIIDDLLELQNEEGTDNKIKKTNILQALPCIYNIINDKNTPSDRGSNNKPTTLHKLKSLIDSIKIDYKTLPTRRMTPTDPSQAVIVWERVLKNLNSLQRQPTRRTSGHNKPKSYEQIKSMINRLDPSNGSYKKYALFTAVPAKHRLMLLKALEADLKQQEQVLSVIKSSKKSISSLPIDKQNEIKEFIEKSKRSIDLSEKVYKNILKSQRVTSNNYLNDRPTGNEEDHRESKSNIEISNFDMSPTLNSKSDLNNNLLKFSREQIINQLMINRLNAYITIKEATESDFQNNIKYNLAKRILTLMKSGNISVAKELFKIFISSNDKEFTEKNEDVFLDQQSQDGLEVRKRPLILALKEPLITIEEPKDIRKQTQENLLKQLFNLEAMNK